jgi:hypothetical protein
MSPTVQRLFAVEVLLDLLEIPGRRRDDVDDIERAQRLAFV